MAILKENMYNVQAKQYLLPSEFEPFNDDLVKEVIMTEGDRIDIVETYCANSYFPEKDIFPEVSTKQIVSVIHSTIVEETLCSYAIFVHNKPFDLGKAKFHDMCEKTLLKDLDVPTIPLGPNYDKIAHMKYTDSFVEKEQIDFQMNEALQVPGSSRIRLVIVGSKSMQHMEHDFKQPIPVMGRYVTVVCQYRDSACKFAFELTGKSTNKS